MTMIQIPESEIGKITLELFALSILAGLARLFLIEKTVVSGWKQFFGGIVFGCLVGYLAYNVSPRNDYYRFTGKIWRFYCVLCAVFGREILFVVRTGVIDLLPFFKKIIFNQARKLSEAWEAYKNSK